MWCSGAGDGIVMMARGPSLSTQFLHLMLIITHITQPIGTVEEVNNKGLSIYYVSSYNKAGSVEMLTNAYLREQGFLKKLMYYDNQH